jgi:hypothetical protein
VISQAWTVDQGKKELCRGVLRLGECLRFSGACQKNPRGKHRGRLRAERLRPVRPREKGSERSVSRLALLAALTSARALKCAEVSRARASSPARFVEAERRR